VGDLGQGDSDSNSPQNDDHEPALALSQATITPLRRGMIANIIQKAKDDAEMEARGTSVWATIKIVQNQLTKVRTSEDRKRTLYALTKAARLAQILMDSAEFSAEKESGTDWVIRTMFKDLMAVCTFSRTKSMT